MNLIRHDLGFSKQESRFPTKATCLAIYSRAVNGEQELAAVLAKSFPWCCPWEDALRDLFAAYTDAKQRQHVLDYDDLLLYWAQMMDEPPIAEDVAGRFDHVLVDEYQDTNRLQASILLKLKPDGRGLTVVGDDAQSIYSFRAATVRNILEFPDQFARPATVVTLERNYRSTEPILAASNAVIGLAAERFTKNLWSGRPSSERPKLVTVAEEIDQARYVAARVLENRESRHRPESAGGAVSGIPPQCFPGGRTRLAGHPVRQVRRVEIPRYRPCQGRAGMPAMGGEPAGSGGGLPRRSSSYRASARPKPGPFSIRPAPPSRLPRSPRWRRRAVATQPSGLPSPISSAGSHTGSPAGRRKSRRCGAGMSLISNASMTTRQARKADLMQLEQIAGSYPSRERFLTELTLDPPDATSDEAGAPLLDEDYLVLSTIHSAKGQEWSAVFVLNAVDGCIPSDLAAGTTEEIEEERRLLYVAMTRAKNQLDLLVPQRFYVHQQPGRGDRHLYASRTRFVPDTLLTLFERQTWPACRQEADLAAPGQTEVRIDVAARSRARWR